MAEYHMESDGKSVISLDDVLAAIAPDGIDGPLPPVHLWNPERSTDIRMEIRADGSWWHDGGKIKRERLVKLFSRILRKDADGQIYLVTPYEKVIVHVADAPFVAVRVDRIGEAGQQQGLAFTTNLGDVAVAGSDLPIRVETDPVSLEPSPYVLVRDGLEAKISRPVFYELADLAEAYEGSAGQLGVWSQGEFFELGPAA
ncbi:MAG: DUF1285 domain-containing protein [Pseudomonadota bacterium]|jgi:hypothetical protein|nr:DUF1285 domain-containing protein [Pseudomonadota bacterium]